MIQLTEGAEVREDVPEMVKAGWLLANGNYSSDRAPTPAALDRTNCDCERLQSSFAALPLIH